MKKEIRYFKVGLFVITSTAFLIAAILFFGAAKYLEPKIYVESYFNESIQGLEVGSPVKYRGITIGHVSEISMISNVYTLAQIKDKEVYNQDIYIEMAITANKVKHFDGKSAQGDLSELVKTGLRVRLTSQGFTGTSYLEITFVDPKENKPEKISWVTKHLYLPSAPSTFTRFTDAVSDILSSLEKIDYAKVFNDIDTLAVTSKKALDETDLPALGEKLKMSLDNFQETSSSFKEISDQMSGVIHDTDLKGTFDNLNKVSTNLKGLTFEAENTLVELSGAMKNANQMLGGYRSRISTILDNTEAASENFKVFSSNAKEYPSQMLWGSPPPALNPKNIK